MTPSFQNIKPLLLDGSNKSSRWFSYIGLGMGVLLLLCCLQMFINIKQMTHKVAIRKNGYDFIPIKKPVTNETMGNKELNMFTLAETEELRQQPFISDVAPLIANNFRVQLSAGRFFDFSTDFFIEAIKNDFIDTVPPSFKWQPGDEFVPMIVSSDFLELYNTAFAPGYGLPQLSVKTLSSLTVTITCYDRMQNPVDYYGKVVALSDRINSFLVPKNFLDWANDKFGGGPVTRSSRIYIKTKDASGADFLKFLDNKGYQVNRDKTIMGGAKDAIKTVVTALGFFGVMVVVLALMLFSFYLQLIIAKSKDNLQLLLTLGYSPGWLGKKVAGQFIPVYMIVIFAALVITQLLQWIYHHFQTHDRPDLSSAIHWSLLIPTAVLLVLTVIINRRMVKKLLYDFYRQQQ